MQHNTVNHTRVENDYIEPLKALYFTIGSLIFCVGGALLWIGIIYDMLQLIIVGAMVTLFDIISCIVSHNIKKDKDAHKNTNHYDCLLQRWYTATIAVIFYIGCSLLWIGLAFEWPQLTYVGIIFHALVLFTVIFDFNINNVTTSIISIKRSIVIIIRNNCFFSLGFHVIFKFII